MFKKYQEVKKQTEVVDFKKFSLNLLFSLIMSLLIISGPLVLLLNLLMYNDFKRIIYFGIACLIVLLVFLTETFYYKNVSDEKIHNIEVVILTDTFIAAIIVFVVVLVLYFLGV